MCVHTRDPLLCSNTPASTTVHLAILRLNVLNPVMASLLSSHLLHCDPREGASLREAKQAFYIHTNLCRPHLAALCSSSALTIRQQLLWIWFTLFFTPVLTSLPLPLSASFLSSRSLLCVVRAARNTKSDPTFHLIHSTFDR